MSKNTAINWAEHAFTPWEGCTKRSQGCAHCYAEVRDNRDLSGTGNHWGPGVSRKPMSDDYWKQPLSWDRAAVEMGTHPIVLAGELSDWCDDDPGVPEGARKSMWELIRRTPHLRWALLTKRTENIAQFLPEDWGEGWENVLLGATVENRAALSRIDDLRAIPAKARYLSIEPLLEDLGEIDLSAIDWAICGGESGCDARVFRPEWAESILRQCQEQGTAPWIKQLGAKPIYLGRELHLTDLDKNGDERPSNNGENWDRWPVEVQHLKVRELPVLDSAGPEVAQSRQHEARLVRIESELGKLAAGLEPEAAGVELKLRGEYISTERQLFLTRVERGQILAAFKVLYGPLRKWSEFLRITGVARRTAYDLVDAVEEAEAAETSMCAESAQSPRAARPAKNQVITAAEAVEKAAVAVERVLDRLPEQDRLKALDKLVERLTNLYADATADRKAA